MVAGLGASGAGLVWYAAPMRDVWSAAGLAPICGHSGFLIAHCPPCYAALALGIGGLAVAANALVGCTTR